METFDGLCEAQQGNRQRCRNKAMKESHGHAICGHHARLGVRHWWPVAVRFRAMVGERDKAKKVCTHAGALVFVSAQPPLVQCSRCEMYLDIDLGGFGVVAIPKHCGHGRPSPSCCPHCLGIATGEAVSTTIATEVPT